MVCNFYRRGHHHQVVMERDFKHVVQKLFLRRAEPGGDLAPRSRILVSIFAAVLVPIDAFAFRNLPFLRERARMGLTF